MLQPASSFVYKVAKHKKNTLSNQRNSGSDPAKEKLNLETTEVIEHTAEANLFYKLKLLNYAITQC